jgi:DNA-binding sugar fermentation-stimulating protein
LELYRRINRFLAEVMLGSTKTMVHVPNPNSRLSELLTPGADVLIREAHVIRGHDNRKTKHSLFAVIYKKNLVGLLGFLSRLFLSWFKSKHNTVVLAYALAIA